MNIRQASAKDLPGVIQVHQEAFQGSLMTKLGPRFLRVYYHTVMTYDNSIFYVAERGEEILGFVAGFVRPESFYHNLSKHRLRLAVSMMPGLWRSPQLLFRVIGNMRQAEKNSARRETRESAELASIAVLPSKGGKGIGKQLVQAFCEAAFARRAEQIFLTTDAEDNVAVNQFYLRLGFKKSEDFVAPGNRLMNKYMITAEAALFGRNAMDPPPMRTGLQ
jgi:ribosomal protein S18 acetylase RimI-like enzyme